VRRPLDLFDGECDSDVDIAMATLIGFDAVGLGGFSAARNLEPWAMVWIEMALHPGHGRNFGFIRQQRSQ
jgi:8-hydroxy-5-deazaflavin:NADPH oxidoreductase